MSHATFQLSDTNPNDTIGGGGCICSELKTADTKGPYVVCYGTDLDSAVSPYVVICAECVNALQRVSQGEALRITEGSVTDQAGVSDVYGDGPDEALEQERRTRKPNRRVDATIDDEDIIDL